MNLSRRGFLGLSFMAAVATQLPKLPEGYRVLFLDNNPLLVTDFVQGTTTIKAKVINGLWDLVIDTRTKTASAYSNHSYGYDAPHITEGLQNSWTYEKLIEVSVPKSVGEVPDELKPRKVMVTKFDEFGEPVMKETLVERTMPVYNGWDEEAQEYITWGGGTVTFKNYEWDKEEVTIDPLHGTGIHYEAVIAAAENKAGIVRPSYTMVDDEEMTPDEVSFLGDLCEVAA